MDELLSGWGSSHGAWLAALLGAESRGVHRVSGDHWQSQFAGPPEASSHFWRSEAEAEPPEGVSEEAPDRGCSVMKLISVLSPRHLTQGS